MTSGYVPQIICPRAKIMLMLGSRTGASFLPRKSVQRCMRLGQRLPITQRAAAQNCTIVLELVWTMTAPSVRE